MKDYDIIDITVQIRVGDTVFKVKDYEALDAGGYLSCARDDDEMTVRYIAEVIMFGNDNENYLKLNRYFDAKYLDYVNDEKAIEDGCAFLHTLSLTYGIDVAVLEHVAEKQWRADT